MTCFAKFTKALAMAGAAAASAAAGAALDTATYAADTASSNDSDVADQELAVIEEIDGAFGFKVYPGDTDGSEAWLELTITRIEEVDDAGVAVAGHAVNSAEQSADLELSENSTDSYANATAYVHSLKLPLPNMTACGARRLSEDVVGNVRFDMIVFADTIAATYGASTIVVRKGELKFNLGSDNWPFCDAANKLVMHVKLQGMSNGAVKAFEADSTPQRNSGKLLRMGAGAADVAVQLPTVAIVDDDSPRTFDVSLSTADTTLSFALPHFNSKLVYDPVISFVVPETTTEAEGRAPANGAGVTSPQLAAILAAVPAMLAAFLW